MKAKVIFEDETGSRKIILNIEQIGNKLNIQTFALPPIKVEDKDQLFVKLSGTLIEQLTK